MKILVTGATGYIGFAVAQACRRAGHIVYGLVRTEEKGVILQQHEIIPVIGDADDPSKWSHYVEIAQIIIDNVMAGPNFGSSNRKLVDLCASLQKGHLTKRYIYTSGILTYGDHPNEIVDENTPGKPSQFVKWRTDFEQYILSLKQIEAVVLRPAFVYGGECGVTNGNFLYSMGFDKNTDHAIVYGNPDKMWSMVHVDDLADAFVRVVEAGSGTVSGQIFNVADDSRNSCTQVMEAMARTIGAKGKTEFLPPFDFWTSFTEAWVVTCNKKARSVLGWQPKHGPFVDEVSLCHSAWKAQKMKVSRV